MYYMYDSLVIAESMHILPHFFLKATLSCKVTEDRGGTTKKNKDKDNGGLFYFIFLILFNL